jgi:hypothetical protein
MSSEASYPTANGKRFTLDVDTDADVPPYQDWAHLLVETRESSSHFEWGCSESADC